MRARIERGPVVIIGGAEDREGGAEILREFVRLAGGERARVSVIAAASEIAPEIAADYVALFRRLGASRARDLKIDSRRDADRDATLDAVGDSTGVFFTGGNQLCLAQTLGGTKLDALLRAKHGGGMALAGTSAGAAVMSDVMISGGPPVSTLRVGSVELSPGLGYVPGVLVDQHFEERGRLRRLLSAVAQHPEDLGLGVDENTAAVVEGALLRVVGAGTITVIDASCLTHTNLAGLAGGELLAICGVNVHVLPAGYGFDLRGRTPVTPGDAAGI